VAVTRCCLTPILAATESDWLNYSFRRPLGFTPPPSSTYLQKSIFSTELMLLPRASAYYTNNPTAMHKRKSNTYQSPSVFLLRPIRQREETTCASSSLMRPTGGKKRAFISQSTKPSTPHSHPSAASETDSTIGASGAVDGVRSRSGDGNSDDQGRRSET
jgi:hypothetical protein